MVQEKRAGICLHGGEKAREVMIMTFRAFSELGEEKEMALIQLVIA